MYPVNGPAVIVIFAQNKFDSNGKLIDEDNRRLLKQLPENLAIGPEGCVSEHPGYPYNHISHFYGYQCET
jgi:hypothetical protein